MKARSAFFALFWLGLPSCNPPDKKLLQDFSRLRSDKKILEIFDSGDSYPLARAAWSGDVEALEGLLKISDVRQTLNERETVESGSYTPLMFAAMKGRAAAISALLRAGADPNIKDSAGAAALIWAADNGSAAAVEALLKAEGVKIDERDSHGWTALAQAAMKGRAAAISALLRAGADPNIKDNNGRAALLWAISRGSAAAVEARLEENGGAKGARRSPIERAALIQAAVKRYDSAVDLLLKAGANPNSTDSSGMTALMAAAQNSGEAPVKKLLAAEGAKPDKRDNGGRSALFYAAKSGRANNIALLLAAGASPALKDGLGRTPLMAAAYAGEIPALKKLLETPPVTNKINEMGQDGKTAFDLAKEGGWLEAVRILQEAGGASGAPALSITFLNIKKAIKSFLKKRPESESRAIAAEKGAAGGPDKSERRSVFQKITDFFKNLF